MQQKTGLIGKGCMKSFCKDLREHGMKIIDYKKKKEMILLTYKKISLMKSKKFVVYVK